MTIRTEQRGPLVRAFVDSWDAPRPERLARMSERYTVGLLAVVSVSLLVVDLAGAWSISAWWGAMAEWAPIGVLVTVFMVVGWQAALTHALLGATELLRTARDATDPLWAMLANLIANAFLWCAWGISCLVTPGLP